MSGFFKGETYSPKATRVINQENAAERARANASLADNPDFQNSLRAMVENRPTTQEALVEGALGLAGGAAGIGAARLVGKGLAAARKSKIYREAIESVKDALVGAMVPGGGTARKAMRYGKQLEKELRSNKEIKGMSRTQFEKDFGIGRDPSRMEKLATRLSKKMDTKSGMEVAKPRRAAMKKKQNLDEVPSWLRELLKN